MSTLYLSLTHTLTFRRSNRIKRHVFFSTHKTPAVNLVFCLRSAPLMRSARVTAQIREAFEWLQYSYALNILQTSPAIQHLGERQHAFIQTQNARVLIQHIQPHLHKPVCVHAHTPYSFTVDSSFVLDYPHKWISLMDLFLNTLLTPCQWEYLCFIQPQKN